jgi:hypothetical protein
MGPFLAAWAPRLRQGRRGASISALSFRRGSSGKPRIIGTPPRPRARPRCLRVFVHSAARASCQKRLDPPYRSRRTADWVKKSGPVSSCQKVADCPPWLPRYFAYPTTALHVAKRLAIRRARPLLVLHAQHNLASLNVSIEVIKSSAVGDKATVLRNFRALKHRRQAESCNPFHDGLPIIQHEWCRQDVERMLFNGFNHRQKDIQRPE